MGGKRPCCPSLIVIERRDLVEINENYRGVTWKVLFKRTLSQFLLTSLVSAEFGDVELPNEGFQSARF